MKTIFDKIDPQYLNHATTGIDCVTGTCGHAPHAMNTITMSCILLILACSLYKYTHESKNEKAINT